MSIKISQILPQEVHSTIPVTLLDPETMDYVIESITVYSPTVERIESFNNNLTDKMNDEEVLVLLMSHFTDVELDLEYPDIAGFKQYFSEIFDTLSLELYRILTIVVKRGLQAKNELANMDDEYLTKLEEAGIQDFAELKRLKETLTKG